jgi:hypothetical protein
MLDPASYLISLYMHTLHRCTAGIRTMGLQTLTNEDERYLDKNTNTL